MKKHLEDIQV